MGSKGNMIKKYMVYVCGISQRINKNIIFKILIRLIHVMIRIKVDQGKYIDEFINNAQT